jgi:hypothetical protein
MSANTGPGREGQLTDLERLRQMGCAREVERMMRRTAFLFSVTVLFLKYVGGLGVGFDHAGPTWF